MVVMLETLCTHFVCSQSHYVPDDEASKEEVAVIEKKREEEDMAKFESDNAEWCQGQKDDIEKRREDRKKKERNAEVERQRGNRLYKQKSYKRAIEAYMLSLSKSAYKTVTLTNISLCHTKMKNWGEAKEFVERALHVDKTCVKALCRKALNGMEEAAAAGVEGLTEVRSEGGARSERREVDARSEATKRCKYCGFSASRLLGLTLHSSSLRITRRWHRSNTITTSIPGEGEGFGGPQESRGGRAG